MHFHTHDKPCCNTCQKRQKMHAMYPCARAHIAPVGGRFALGTLHRPESASIKSLCGHFKFMHVSQTAAGPTCRHQTQLP